MEAEKERGTVGAMPDVRDDTWLGASRPQFAHLAF